MTMTKTAPGPGEGEAEGVGWEVGAATGVFAGTWAVCVVAQAPTANRHSTATRLRRIGRELYRWILRFFCEEGVGARLWSRIAGSAVLMRKCTIDITN